MNKKFERDYYEEEKFTNLHCSDNLNPPTSIADIKYSKIPIDFFEDRKTSLWNFSRLLLHN